MRRQPLIDSSATRDTQPVKDLAQPTEKTTLFCGLQFSLDGVSRSRHNWVGNSHGILMQRIKDIESIRTKIPATEISTSKGLQILD